MKRFAIALSLANLCFLASWRDILSPPFNGYHLETNATAMKGISIFFDVFLFAAILAVMSLLNRRDRHFHRVIQMAFIGLFIVALNNILKEFVGSLSIARLSPIVGKTAAVTLTCMLAILGVCLLVRWNQAITSFARVFLLVAFPLVVLNAYYVASFLFQSNLILPNTTALAATRPEDPAGLRPKQRIVFIVFDELDYRVAFSTRPASITLPELDRFANDSFFATNAYSPAGATLLSMPALTTGKLVADARQRSFDQLSIRFADQDEYVDWSSQPTIFSEMKDRGASIGVVGWYHPYCRMFGDILGRCSTRASLASWPIPPSYPLSVIGGMKEGFLHLGKSIPLIRDVLPNDHDYRQEWNRSFIAADEHLTERADEIVGDAQYSFVFLHLPATHGPYLFDRKTADFDQVEQHDYFDNLIYVDKVFGQIRQSMEQSGIWDSSNVIVTSDHWWRTAIWNKQGVWSEDEADLANAEINYKVPFIIKTDREKDGDVQKLTYAPIFNNVLAHDLILAIDNGEVSTKSEIASWLDHHRSFGHTEYGMSPEK